MRLARTALIGAVASVTLITSVAPVMAAAPSNDRDPAAKQARSDNRPGPLTERQNARRKAAQELILSGKASPNEDGVVQLADDKYFQAAVTGTGQGLHDPVRVRRPGTGKLGRDARPAPQRDPASPTATRSTTPRTGCPTSARRYYDDLFFGAGESFADFYTKQSSGQRTPVDGNRRATGSQVPGNASTYGDNTVEDFGGSWQFIEDSGQRLVPGAARRSVRSTADQGLARARSTSGTATTTTTTATSTSRTATSTTSRRSTPVRARTPAAAPRARTRSGRTAGTSTDRLRPDRSDRRRHEPGSAARRSATPGSGSATTRSRPRTAASACSRTSSATTSACPTTTTPTAARTAPPSGRSCPSGSWLDHGTARTSAPSPDYMGPWEKLQLGWLDYAGRVRWRERDLHPEPCRPPGRRPGAGRHRSTCPTRPSTTTYTTPYSGSHAWWTEQRRRPEHDADPQRSTSPASRAPR